MGQKFVVGYELILADYVTKVEKVLYDGQDEAVADGVHLGMSLTLFSLYSNLKFKGIKTYKNPLLA